MYVFSCNKTVFITYYCFRPHFVLNGEEVRVGWVSKKITPRHTQTLWSIHICGPICRCVYTHRYIYIKNTYKYTNICINNIYIYPHIYMGKLQ